MKIKIRGVADSKNHSKERLILDVTEADELGHYILFDTTYINTKSISNKVRHTYWFPDRKVKAGDVVVLYTKEGTESKTTNADGSTNYFYYMGLKNSVWNNDGDAAVLLHADLWSTKSVK